jgi:hypothetical protein
LRKPALRDALHAQAPRALRQQADYTQRSASDEHGATAPAGAAPRSFSSPHFSLARSLLGSRAMAAVDVSRVVALTNKALALKSKGHFAGAAEKYAEAVTAAQALHQPDCVVVAQLQASHANALVGHAQMAGVPEARRVELRRSAFLELLPPAMASLERRMAAGTLLAGACRPYEVAWCAAKTVHANALTANMPDAAMRVTSTAEELSAWTAYVGYNAYITTAAIALELCAFATNLSNAGTLNLTEATADACSVFVERAFDMMQLRTGPVNSIEVPLVRNAQTDVEEQQRFFHATCKWHARILAAWRRLQSSGVLQRRGILQCMSGVVAYNTHVIATAAATAAARGLHFCALPTCGAQEVHASQFKRCSACSGVVYCCKEHQVQDWPAHKAACRAARKAAEAADDEASGA